MGIFKKLNYVIMATDGAVKVGNYSLWGKEELKIENGHLRYMHPAIR